MSLQQALGGEIRGNRACGRLCAVLETRAHPPLHPINPQQAIGGGLMTVAPALTFSLKVRPAAAISGWL